MIKIVSKKKRNDSFLLCIFYSLKAYIFLTHLHVCAGGCQHSKQVVIRIIDQILFFHIFSFSSFYIHFNKRWRNAIRWIFICVTFFLLVTEIYNVFLSSPRFCVCVWIWWRWQLRKIFTWNIGKFVKYNNLIKLSK